MEGAIGVLYQDGEQVGGIFNWGISAGMDNYAKDDWVEVKVAKMVTAQSYWLVNKPNGDTFDVKFYQHMEGQLVLIDTGTVGLNLPEVNVLNKTLPAPLRLIWMNSLSF